MRNQLGTSGSMSSLVNWGGWRKERKKEKKLYVEIVNLKERLQHIYIYIYQQQGIEKKTTTEAAAAYKKADNIQSHWSVRATKYNIIIIIMIIIITINTMRENFLTLTLNPLPIHGGGNLLPKLFPITETFVRKFFAAEICECSCFFFFFFFVTQCFPIYQSYLPWFLPWLVDLACLSTTVMGCVYYTITVQGCVYVYLIPFSS